MCFPDFIGLQPLGLPFCARPGRKKYRSAARMIFSCPAKPLRAALRQKAGNPRPLPLKSGKTDSFLYGYKKMQTFRPAFSWLIRYRCYSSFVEWVLKMSSVISLARVLILFRKSCPVIIPLSSPASCFSQSAVSEVSAIFFPRMVS